MKRVIFLLALGCIGASKSSGCMACLSAAGELSESISKIQKADDERRARALQQRTAILEEEARVRLEIARLRSRAVELEAEIETEREKAAARAPNPWSSPAVVAVLFDLDPAGVMNDERARLVTEQLHLELAGHAGLRLLPLEQVRGALVKEAEGSYSACVDEECQIELGKALAATKALVPVVWSKEGDENCIFGLIAYDLEREAAEWARSIDCTCDPDGLAIAIQKLAALTATPREVPQQQQEIAEEPASQPKRPPRTPFTARE